MAFLAELACIHPDVSLSCFEQSQLLTAARHEMVAESEPKL